MFGSREYARALEPLLPRAGGYALALLRNRHDAEDAVQQAALRGLERITTFDITRPFQGWWFAILRNCCMDCLRRTRSTRTDNLENHVLPAPSEEPAADWERLDAAIETISEAHREILRLRYFGDLSYVDLAEVLSIPKGTVMSRLHLARQALAMKLREDEA